MKPAEEDPIEEVIIPIKSVYEDVQELQVPRPNDLILQVGLSLHIVLSLALCRPLGEPLFQP